jgi:hypothetical protein
MPVEEAPEDDDVRQTYNFAPGSHGLVYRADVPEYGAGRPHDEGAGHTVDDPAESEETPSGLEDPKETKYKLQAMKWGTLLQAEALCP